MSKNKKQGRVNTPPHDDDLMTGIIEVIAKTGVARGPDEVAKTPEHGSHFGYDAHLTPTREECGL